MPGRAGKSRLLAETARHEQVPVPSCQVFPSDRDEPWSLAGRLLAQAWRLAGPDGTTLPDPQARALAGLIPGLVLPGDGEPARVTPRPTPSAPGSSRPVSLSKTPRPALAGNCRADGRR